MNKYEAPKMEVIELAKYDVIMTSGDSSDAGSDWGGSGEEEWG